MNYGICNLSIVPVRIEASNKSEMVTQLLFGEHFTILEAKKNWCKIRNAIDNYEGWIDTKQFLTISEETFNKIEESQTTIANELIDFVNDKKENFFTIPIGSNLPFYENQHFFLNETCFYYEGKINDSKQLKSSIPEIAFKFLNTPYLWGGKSPFGIDCSGFTQLVYKICGYNLLRDASQQASQGVVLSFIEESEPGDLAFFDDEEGNITHVGILLKDNFIIHAHGKVRIDKIDYSGIFNLDSNKHTHKLRIIKKII